MLFGRRVDTTGIYDLKVPPRDGRCRHCDTLPGIFKRAGYRTIGIGKISHGRAWSADLGHDGTSLSWSEAHIDFDDQYGTGGFFCDSLGQNCSSQRSQSSPWRFVRQPTQPMNSTRLLSEADEAVGAMADAQVVDHALLKLGELTAAVETRPWLLAVGLHQPHLPFVAPQRSYAPYSDDEAVALARHGYCPWGLPTKAFASFEMSSFLDVPRWFAGEYARCNQTLDDATARRLRRGYYASVTHVDEQIGRLLRGLRDANGGAAWNAVTCIWSDHGFELGEHGSWSKHTLWHVTTRIPLLLRVPGTTPAAGAISDGLVEALDIMPTVWQAATGGTLDTCPGERPWEPRNCTEGVSFLPLAAEPHSASGWKRLVLSQYLRRSTGVMGYSMTTHDGVRFTRAVKR